MGFSFLSRDVNVTLVSILVNSIPPLIALFAVLMQLSDLLSAGFSLYKANNNAVESYDFIVVGAGSAGSALAARLSEDPTVSVLLLEAGGDPNPLTYIPGATPYLGHPSIEWLYSTVPQNGSALGMINQTVLWPRGKAVGGSSNVNFMVYNRGNQNDFDRWAQLTGDLRWSFKNVEKYFLKMEDYYGYWMGENYHRKGGPLRIEPLGYTPGVEYILRAAKEQGYPIRDANRIQIPGFSPLDFTQKRGTRFGTYLAYIQTAQQRPNFRLLRYSVATRIHFDEELRAVGVTYLRHGVEMRAEAKREIIISCGSIATPQLLMLSGIGPLEHLQELGIPPLLDLPVGENLQDHVITFVGPFLLSKPESYIPERDLSLTQILNYFTSGTGPLSLPLVITTCGLIATPNAPSPLWPDIMWTVHSLGMHADIGPSLDAAYNTRDNLFQRWLAPVLGQDAHFINQMLGLPKSVGNLRLRDANPESLPIIDPRYYSDPEGKDLETMAIALELAVRLYENTTSLGGILGARLHPQPLPGCEGFPHRSHSYWECVARTLTGTLFHPSGTCAMGKIGVPGTVVDSSLRVLGTKGLRLADASIMPKVTNANLNAPTIMIGELAADLVKETWGPGTPSPP